MSAAKVLAVARARLAPVQGALVLSIMPPPVQGIGNAGGFKMMVQDRGGSGSKALERAAQALTAAANKDPAIAGVFTLFNTRTPSVYADIDRERAEKLSLDPSTVFSALQLYLGSKYINDFNYLGRTYEVIAEADAQFRRDQCGYRAAAAAQRDRRHGAAGQRGAVREHHRAIPGAAL